MVIKFSNTWNTYNEVNGSSKNGGICKFFEFLKGERRPTWEEKKATNDEKKEGLKTFAALFANLKMSGETMAVFDGSAEELEKFFKICRQDNIVSYDLIKRIGRDICSGIKEAVASFNANGEKTFGTFGETVQNIVTRWSVHEHKADCEEHKSRSEKDLKFREIDFETDKVHRDYDLKEKKARNEARKADQEAEREFNLKEKEAEFEARKAERELEKKFSKKED